MPTYEYACRSCGHRFEEVHSIHDDALTECPNCGGELRKVVGSVGIAFKGPGFYRTDSRSSATDPAKPSGGADATGATDGGPPATGDKAKESPTETSTKAQADKATGTATKGNGKTSTGGSSAGADTKAK